MGRSTRRPHADGYVPLYATGKLRRKEFRRQQLVENFGLSHAETGLAGAASARNQSRDARSTLNPAPSSRATTSSIDCGSRASHSTSIIVSFAGSRVKMRLWLISM